MTRSHRRRFLKTTGMGVLAASSAGMTAKGASHTVRHAVLGLGNRGMGHISMFANQTELCRVVAVCDVDPERRERGRQSTPNPSEVKSYEDYREILERDDIDAVSIATPDHWHAKMAIEAAQAGKHVYVEKPCCHNLAEGQALLRAEAEYGRCMQHGTQRRSDKGVHEALAFLKAGELGQVRMAKTINHQMRGPIGRKTPQSPPAGVNYDLWLGPAPEAPFTQNRWHYQWHWFWEYGTGDLGNDGIHFIDLCRWGLGVTYPLGVTGSGGQLFYEDDHETPDTQMITFEYPNQFLAFEMRLWTDYELEGHHNAAVFYCDEGRLDLGGELFALKKNGEKISFPGSGASSWHARNFLQCIVNETPEKLNAPMQEAVPTTALCHLGNIATRIKQHLEYDPDTLHFNHKKANDLINRQYRPGYEFPDV